MVSFLVHSIAGLLLAVWMLPSDSTSELFAILARREPAPDPDEVPVEIDEIVQPQELVNRNVDSAVKQLLSELTDGLTSHELDVPAERDFRLPVDALTELQEIPVQHGEFGGRSQAGRRAAVRRYGGTAESELAVVSGLEWLQSIQRGDGSWNFAAAGDAGGAGSFNTTDMGATALAMLCFLGAGHTHLSEGPFQPTVRRGMDWMQQSARTGSWGTDLRGDYQGNAGMYVQGIAAIVLCEAAAMEPDDRDIRRLAIGAIDFIERAQDPFGGGWRYEPRDPGDTSVTGWQVMALQSARAGRIRVASTTFRDVRLFLNTVEAGGGAYYGYRGPQLERHAMTAVGLLCRMYLGWKRDHDGLRRGVEHLSRLGPSRDDMYFNYYATQVLYHWGGDPWQRWNERMREQLVETQLRDGPGAGSWNVTDPHGAAGGRIYQTALSILTLEVYYRHLPLYQRLEHLPDDKPAGEASDAAAED